MPSEINFFNPRSLIVFIAILQGVIFAALLLFRSFKHSKKADFWLAMLLLVMCSSLITPFIGFANVYDFNQWLTYFPFNSNLRLQRFDMVLRGDFDERKAQF